MPNTARNHRDNVFCMLYRDRGNLLSLYNAVNGTDYRNEEELDVVSLEHAICISMRNDAAFLIDSRLNLYEQQATVNENMPLRDLYYVAEEFESGGGEPELELIVRQININRGYNDSILEKCESLSGYVFFVEKVREKTEAGIGVEDAVTEAVDECIREGVLRDFFTEHRREVIEMGIFEYDAELHDQVLREESYEHTEDMA